MPTLWSFFASLISPSLSCSAVTQSVFSLCHHHRNNRQTRWQVPFLCIDFTCSPLQWKATSHLLIICSNIGDAILLLSSSPFHFPKHKKVPLCVIARMCFFASDQSLVIGATTIDEKGSFCIHPLIGHRPVSNTFSANNFVYNFISVKTVPIKRWGLNCFGPVFSFWIFWLVFWWLLATKKWAFHNF